MKADINGYELRSAGTVKGFTLLEVMLAMMVFLIGALAIAKLQGTVAKGNADARSIAEATKLARQVMEEMEQYRSFYWVKNEGCYNLSMDFESTTAGPITVTDALKDPESVLNGEEDPLCPSATQNDDLDKAMESLNDDTISDAALAVEPYSDKCIQKGGSCAPVDAFFNFAPLATNAKYWVTWNLRAGWPKNGNSTTARLRMTTVKVVVFWRGMDHKRHAVSVSGVMTAKDDEFYY